MRTLPADAGVSWLDETVRGSHQWFWDASPAAADRTDVTTCTMDVTTCTKEPSWLNPPTVQPAQRVDS